MNFCETFSAIPDVIWSGVIASVLTLGGVLISNRSNTARLRIQLSHDSEQKAQERTSVLRREVYLKVAEELTKANTYLASLSQIDPTKSNLADGFQGFFGAASKLQLVAESKTALLVNKLVASYAELMLRLIAQVMPLQEARSDISIHDALYNEAQGQVTRVLGEMTKFNEAAQRDEQVFAALQRSFDGFQAQAKNHAEARDRAWATFNRRNVEFCKQLFIEMRVVGEQQIPVLIEIRRDLGLKTDLEAYQEQMESQWLRMASQLEVLLNSLGISHVPEN